MLHNQYYRCWLAGDSRNQDTLRFVQNVLVWAQEGPENGLDCIHIFSWSNTVMFSRRFCVDWFVIYMQWPDAVPRTTHSRYTVAFPRAFTSWSDTHNGGKICVWLVFVWFTFNSMNPNCLETLLRFTLSTIRSRDIINRCALAMDSCI